MEPNSTTFSLCHLWLHIKNNLLLLDFFLISSHRIMIITQKALEYIWKNILQERTSEKKKEIIQGHSTTKYQEYMGTNAQP
jgi:hypothetical protein